MAAAKKPSLPSTQALSTPSATASLPRSAPVVQTNPINGKTVSNVANKPKPVTVKVAQKTPLAPAGKPSAKKALLKKAVSRKLPPKTVKASKVGKKVTKEKKPKLIRDSFTIPKAEYEVLELLKDRAAKLARPVKKSELLRAGIKALAALSGAAFLTALNEVPTIKTGRPSLKS